MASRKASDGAISPTTPMPNGNGNRASSNTPLPAPGSAWNGTPVGRGFGPGDAFFGTLGTPLRAGAASFEPGKEFSSRMKVLSLGTMPDVPLIVSSAPVLAKPAQMPVGTKSAGSSPTHPKAWFSTDLDSHKPFMGTHFLLIEGLKEVELQDGVLAVIEQSYNEDIRGKKLVKSAAHSEYIDVVIFINDLRSSTKIYQDLEGEGLLTVRHVTYDWYNNGASACASSVDPKTTYVGQVTFIAEFKGRTADFDHTVNVYDKVREIVSQFGVVSAFEQNKSANFPSWKFRVEFFKYSSAERAIAKAGDGMKTDGFEGWVVFAYQYVPETHSSAGLPQRPFPDIKAVQAIVPAPNGADIIMSPTGRTAWYTDENGVTHAVPPPRPVANIDRGMVESRRPHEHSTWKGKEPDYNGQDYAPAATHALVPYNGPYNGHGNMSMDSGYHEPIRGNEVGFYRPRDFAGRTQDIIPERIHNGLDCRTTVMLRNVPHHWTWRDIKTVLDQACRNRYNFMYLRMDFQQGKNVGYCFVNFETPVDICDFVNNFVGLAWEPGLVSYSKPKIIQVSYATIQGLESLIDKFRNSSVMDEIPDYRPCLFQTVGEKVKDETRAAQLCIQGLQAPPVLELGEKKPFPEPNNRAKKERSTANAGQIGLFTPRASRMVSERYHRSQYDRGTTAQLMEEQFHHFGGHMAGPSSVPHHVAQFFAGAQRFGAVYPPTFAPGPYMQGLGIDLGAAGPASEHTSADTGVGCFDRHMAVGNGFGH